MTTTIIDAAFDGYTDEVTSTETDADLWVGFDGVYRTFVRFSLSGITAGSDVTDVDLGFNVESENVEAGEGVEVNRYNNSGDADPEADSAATQFSRAAAGTALIALIDCNGTGLKSGDLGTVADSDVEGNISSPGFYSIGIVPSVTDPLDAGEGAELDSLEKAGTNHPKLTVVYTEPSNPTAGESFERHTSITSVLVRF